MFLPIVGSLPFSYRYLNAFCSYPRLRKSNISRIKEWSCVFSCVNFMTSLLNHRTLPPFIVVEDWREFLNYIIMTTKPQDTFFNLVVQTAWAMACISKYTEMKFEPILIAKMVTYLGHSNSQLLEPTLIALGNAVIRTTESAQAALDAGVLQHAERLLGNVSYDGSAQKK